MSPAIKRALRTLVSLSVTIGLLSFVYIVMRFAILFDINLCYSSGLSNITEAHNKIASSNNAALKSEFEVFIKNIPNHGYETDCEEIKTFTGAFLKHVNETLPTQAKP